MLFAVNDRILVPCYTMMMVLFDGCFCFVLTICFCSKLASTAGRSLRCGEENNKARNDTQHSTADVIRPNVSLTLFVLCSCTIIKAIKRRRSAQSQQRKEGGTRTEKEKHLVLLHCALGPLRCIWPRDTYFFFLFLFLSQREGGADGQTGKQKNAAPTKARLRLLFLSFHLHFLHQITVRNHPCLREQPRATTFPFDRQQSLQQERQKENK